jgi:hypothetical protein
MSRISSAFLSLRTRRSLEDYPTVEARLEFLEGGEDVNESKSNGAGLMLGRGKR